MVSDLEDGSSPPSFFLVEPAMVQRVIATPKALILIERLTSEHGALMFHQSGGCCDGGTPMCFKQGEMPVGPATDVLLGHIGGVPYYASRSLAEFSQNLQYTIDVVRGEGGSFSLENGSGECFQSKGRLCSDEEVAQLPPLN
jgi:uncharacterized protein (DUF779 family)